MKPDRRPLRSFRCLLLLPLLACVAPALAFCADIEKPDIFADLLLNTQTAGRVGVISSDLGSAGRFSTVSLDGLPFSTLTGVHSDAVGRFHDGRVYIVNRLNRDNIQVLQPSLLTVLEFSVGAGSNPHDIAIASSAKAYVSLYERNYLLVVNPTVGAIIGSISLAAYADADGIPEASALYIDGGSLYVALQRLDRNDPSGKLPPNSPSILLEIDTATDTIVAAHTFPDSRNPFGRFRPVNLGGVPHIAIACPNRLGFISALDGGVQAFNLVTRSFRPGLLYGEVAAGGDILDVVFLDQNRAYASVLDAAFNKTLQRFDPITGQRTAVLAFFPADSGFISGLELSPDGSRLFTGNVDLNAPGISVYDTRRGDVPITAAPISVGLRPIDLFSLE